MTHERFFSLIETYGAEPARWPVEWRAEAQALMRSGSEAISRALDDARALDADMSHYRVHPADAALIGRMTALGPNPPWWRQLNRNVGWWVSSAGLVGVGLGGVAAGALSISLLVPVPTVAVSASSGSEESSVGTAFGEVRMKGDER